jgi:hypothetical protein
MSKKMQQTKNKRSLANLSPWNGGTQDSRLTHDMSVDLTKDDDEQKETSPPERSSNSPTIALDFSDVDDDQFFEEVRSYKELRDERETCCFGLFFWLR